MKQIVLVLSLLVATPVFAQMDSYTPFIIGGVNAKVNEFPYIVSLQSNFIKKDGKRFGHFCGGTLIAKNWILTAAHCLIDENKTGIVADEIWVGMYDQSDVRSVEKIKPLKLYPHPKYNKYTSDYDYGLIELEQNSSYSTMALNETEINIGTKTIMAMVAGWGTTAAPPLKYSSPNILQKVEVPLVTNAECNSPVVYAGEVTDRMLCAGYQAGVKDACSGDSGGPLIVKNASGKTVIAGIVSWGYGCADVNAYGVYSKVNAEISWIKTTAGIH